MNIKVYIDPVFVDGTLFCKTLHSLKLVQDSLIYFYVNIITWYY